MPYQPAFMHQLDSYYVEAKQLQTLDQWLAFDKKWFNKKNWPQRKVPTDKCDYPHVLGTRLWGKCFWHYDLNANARYHYFAVFLGVGDRIKFPHLFNTPKHSYQCWSQYCAYCEIMTNELGDQHCPQCSRQLLSQYTED